MAGESITLVEKSKKRFGGGYIKGIKDELKKVSWTSKAELILCTKVVVGATFVFGLGIYLADLTIRGALNWIHMIMHLITG